MMKYITLALFLVTFTATTAFAQDGAVSEAGDVYSDTQAIEITDGYELYGEPMPDVMEKFRLAEAIDRYQELIGAEMQITGMVARMCRSNDCFVMLEDAGKEAKVILVDPSAAMPDDIDGREITVFGILEVIESTSPPQTGADAKDAPKKFRMMIRSVKLHK
jgi:hypothetical protein